MGSYNGAMILSVQQHGTTSDLDASAIKRGGSTGAADSRRTSGWLVQRAAASGGLRGGCEASGQARGVDVATAGVQSLSRGGGCVKSRHKDYEKTENFRGSADRGRHEFSTIDNRAGCPRKFSKRSFLKNSYGKWVRWEPPAPKRSKVVQQGAAV